MKLFSGSTIFGTLATAALLFVTLSGTTAKADSLSARITNKVLNEHRANVQAGILPRQRAVNKAIDNRVEGAKTVASALNTSAPVMTQHPSDEVEPARGPKSGHFIPRKK